LLVEPLRLVEPLPVVEPLPFDKPLILVEPADPSETVVVVAATGGLAVWLLLTATAATMAITRTAAALPQKIGF
jgi:hypothetical protein